MRILNISLFYLIEDEKKKKKKNIIPVYYLLTWRYDYHSVLELPMSRTNFHLSSNEGIYVI